MNASTRITAAATAAVGAGAIIGALALSAPASAKPLHTATSIQPTCEQHPDLYASGATLGVYSTQRRGADRDQICKVYDPTHKLLGTYTATDYGYYTVYAPGVPPVKSAV
jgi:hypothetical protein